MNNDGCFEVVWPRSARQVRHKQLAARHETLHGKVVAELWDYLFRGDEVFETLEEGLRERFPDVRFVSWREFGNTHGSDEREVMAALPQRLKALGVNAVISGMAAEGAARPPCCGRVRYARRPAFRRPRW